MCHTESATENRSRRDWTRKGRDSDVRREALVVLGILAAGLTAGLAPTRAWAVDPQVLRWGADKAGGEPFIYEDDSGQLRGFEVELAEYLAKKLGKRSEVYQGGAADWSKLPELLVNREIDVVLNGYEYDPEREKLYASTIPYYIYRFNLLVNQASPIRDWIDLASPSPTGGKRRVGVLGGSTSEAYVEKRFGQAIELRRSEDVANLIGLVERNENLDATVQDNTAAVTFVRKTPGLKIVGEAVAPGYYVMLTRPADREFREQLNQALRAGIEDGTLEAIYRKYGIWNDDQQRLKYLAAAPWPPVASADDQPAEGPRVVDWGYITERLLRAAGMTLFLSVVSFPLAMLLGLFIALLRLFGPLLLRIAATVYVEVIRGTPLLLQLYVIFYLTPRVTNVALPPEVAGIIGLALNYAAYEAENYRAGLLAVPRGQMEAGLALGMTKLQVLRRVVVPQAVRIVIPPVTNDFINLFKDTSVCSVILITELTRQYNTLYNFNRDLVLELALLTGGLYLLMSYPLSLLASRLERQAKADEDD
jgi:polar amino acid transport system substrate-binding protein